MKTSRSIPTIVIACVPALSLFVGGTSALEAQQNRHTLSGDRVAVYNLAGEVSIRGGTGNAVVVEVTTGGSDGSQLTFETGQVCGANALRIIYPDDDIVYGEYRGSTQLDVRDDGTFYGNRNWHGGYDWGCPNRGRGRDDVRIDSRGSGLEAFADLEISVPPGKTLEVYLAVGRVTASNIEGRLILDLGAVSVEASDITGDLLVDTGSGRVVADGVTGNTIIDTGSGGVTADNITGNILLVDTGSGSVEGRSITVDDLSVDTGSGSVDLEQVSSPRILVDTGSGSVDLELITAVEDLNVDTGSGSVDVWLAGELDARVEIDTGSGGIDIDFPISVSRWQRTHVEGVVGRGSGRILIDTGSGGVTLRQLR